MGRRHDLLVFVTLGTLAAGFAGKLIARTIRSRGPGRPLRDLHWVAGRSRGKGK